MITSEPDCPIQFPSSFRLATRQATIAEVVERSFRAFEEMGREGEVLVVNDGSSDSTGLVLDQLSEQYPNLRVMTHRRSQGMTSALAADVLSEPL